MDPGLNSWHGLRMVILIVNYAGVSNALLSDCLRTAKFDLSKMGSAIMPVGQRLRKHKTTVLIRRFLLLATISFGRGLVNKTAFRFSPITY